MFAREITGIHWNGFLFFKLKSPILLESTVAVDLHEPALITMITVYGYALSVKAPFADLPLAALIGARGHRRTIRFCGMWGRRTSVF